MLSNLVCQPDGVRALMQPLAQPSSRDLYVGCYCDVDGWGGALTFAGGLLGAARQRGLSTLALGVTPEGVNGYGLPPNVHRLNLSVASAPLLWRVQSWRVIGLLCRQLRRLSPPTRAFVALSAYWAVAAKRAWPTVPVYYKVPCLLANCLPFTWPGRRPPSFWKRVDFVGVRRAERLAFSHSNLVIVPTDAAAAEIQAFAPGARKRLAVCAYGVEPATVRDDPRAGQRRRLGIGDQECVFLLAGVCDLNKAFELAVRAMPAVDPRGRLLIVGRGPRWQHLEKLALELGVADRVLLIPAQQDMAPRHAAADCVLSTSHYDMFPNTVQEGWAYGRPAIVPRHDPPHVYAGAAEVIEQHGGGLLYDRRRPGALAAAMNELVTNRVLADRLGREGREIASHRAGYDRCLDIIVGRCGDDLPHAPAEQKRECLHVS